MCAHRRGASFGCLCESDRQLRVGEIRTADVASGSRSDFRVLHQRAGKRVLAGLLAVLDDCDKACTEAAAL